SSTRRASGVRGGVRCFPLVGDRGCLEGGACRTLRFLLVRCLRDHGGDWLAPSPPWTCFRGLLLVCLFRAVCDLVEVVRHVPDGVSDDLISGSFGVPFVRVPPYMGCHCTHGADTPLISC